MYYYKLISLNQSQSQQGLSFNLATGNLIELNGKRVSLGVVPNQTKSNLASNELPDIVVIPEYFIGNISLMGVFFLAVMSSAQKKTPMTIVVTDKIMKERLITYMEEGFRPNIMKHLDTLNISEEDRVFLKNEYEYFDQAERSVDEMMTIITMEDCDLDIKREGADYYIGGRKYFTSDIKPIDIGGLKPLPPWTPTFGVLTVGNTSGAYGHAPATNLIVRYNAEETSRSLWIDCGPQMRELAMSAGENIESIDLVLTHGHEDHDVGIWDLLLDQRCKRINLITHLIYADSFFKKAKALNLLDRAKEKVILTELSPRNATSSQRTTLQIHGLNIQAEWAVHGMPTISLKIQKDGKTFIYTSDTAVSSERISTLLKSGAMTDKRVHQLQDFFMIPHCDLFIEEMGAMLLDGEHRGGVNHNNSLDTIKPNHIGIHRVVHWNAANKDMIPPTIKAPYMEPITIIH